MKESFENTVNQEKPPFLYHGSPNGEIDEFTPRISMGSGEKFGPKVYASDDIAVASMMTTRLPMTWGGGVRNGEVYCYIPMTRDEFRKFDSGGWIYKLDSDAFSMVEGGGMSEKEWASEVPIRPVEKIRVESSYDEMIKHGVRMYFKGEDGYDEISNLGKNKV
jgi:hypothetical protein